jgi:tetratricopeptide (TPR) repeat protein
MQYLPARTPAARLSTALVGLLCALVLGACAHKPVPPSPLPLLHDELFPDMQAQLVPSPESVFELSPPMLQYVETRLGSAAARREPRRLLLEALYKNGELRLSYDGSGTRNAAQAFEARAGNCLSLVIMTAAFARHLALPVSYQSVQVEDSYTRSGDLMLVSGHVNLLLGQATRSGHVTWSADDEWVIDFLPGSELRGQRTHPLQEKTVLAMYFNNRAAEVMAEGHLTQSYALVREALHLDPDYLSAVNTLAVVYLRSGHLEVAELALRQVLAQQADSLSALSNLALVLQRSGRGPEAETLLARLARLQPDAPTLALETARRELDQGHYALARDLFERELSRQPGQSEVHFWAALADWQLGNAAGAARHLQQAALSSTSNSSRELYAAKLARLRALQAQ